jgi:hypothetical protein
MRSNSASGKANDDLHDATLKEREQARGNGGEATAAKSGHGKRQGTAGNTPRRRSHRRSLPSAPPPQALTLSLSKGSSGATRKRSP